MPLSVDVKSLEKSFVVFNQCLLSLRASTASVLLKVKTFTTNCLSSS